METPNYGGAVKKGNRVTATLEMTWIEIEQKTLKKYEQFIQKEGDDHKSGPS